MNSLNNSNGFQTKIWGPPAWFFLHLIAQNYSPQRKSEYLKFFNSLTGVLPCGSCRDNYSKILKEIPIEGALKTRELLVRWLFMVHNRVQSDIYEKTKKDSDKPYYKNTEKDLLESVRFYEQFRAQCVSNMYGCVIPRRGARKRSTIKIKAFLKPRRSSAFLVD